MSANRRNDSPSSRPLHPPLVHVPIGAVVVAASCDLISIVGGASHGWAQTWFKGGSYALLVGTGGLVIAAASGLVDRARQTETGSPERRAVAAHAAVMTLMAVVCVLDLLLRSNTYASAQHTPAVVLILTLMALALAAAGGELGGRLVYGGGIGVQPRASEEVRSHDARTIARGPVETQHTAARLASRPGNNPGAFPPWRIRLAMTVVAWLVAFGLVMTLLTILGRALPLAVRALAISGVLVTAMTYLVLPTLSAAARRWQAAMARTGAAGPSPSPGPESVD